VGRTYPPSRPQAAPSFHRPGTSSSQMPGHLRTLPKKSRLDALQIFFDAVEDGVRLRSLAAVTFVVLFAAILTLLLGFGTHTRNSPGVVCTRSHSLFSRAVHAAMQCSGTRCSCLATTTRGAPKSCCHRRRTHSLVSRSRPARWYALKTLQAESGRVFV
jgi:hypothetical protein